MLIIYVAMTFSMMKLRIMTLSATKTKISHSLFTITTCYSVFPWVSVHGPTVGKSPVLLVVVVQSEYECLYVNNIWRHNTQHNDIQREELICDTHHNHTLLFW
jgi:hypothetical protein